MKKKKFTDRRDGEKLKTDGVHKLMLNILPKRTESETYLNKTIDVTNLVKYIEEKKKKDSKITYFHAFSTAIGRSIYNYPSMNKFIIGGSFYKRNDISIGFVAKTSFTDSAKECLNVIKVEDKDTINSISKKISGDVKKIRSNTNNDTDSAIEFIGKLPKILRCIIMKIIKFMDNHDLLPQTLTNNSVYHCSILVSNLGSINCPSIYHHLTNFGTNSVIMTIGKIHKEVLVIDGKKEIRDVCDFGITIDERIGDGYYFAKAVNLFEYILNNPELLEEHINDRVDL